MEVGVSVTVSDHPREGAFLEEVIKNTWLLVTVGLVPGNRRLLPSCL